MPPIEMVSQHEAAGLVAALSPFSKKLLFANNAAQELVRVCLAGAVGACLVDYLMTSIFSGEFRPPLATKTTSTASQKNGLTTTYPFQQQKRIVHLENVLTEWQNGSRSSRRGTFSW